MLHSEQVCSLAVELGHRLVAKGVEVDMDFVAEAAMLHDIGVIKTDAPGIYCFGDEPYIRHGIIGRKILDEMGMPRHALVCERHTGAGLSLDDILSQDLPLPHRDMLPVTIEERLVCYADKFYSKSHQMTIKPISKIRMQMSRFGEASLLRFNAMAEEFGEP
ncbi:MAG: HD domain-containing protein [Muribaculaceae bacterium]|nr:HD domain-containing protein [Muribaculaceae bacterium]